MHDTVESTIAAERREEAALARAVAAELDVPLVERTDGNSPRFQLAMKILKRDREALRQLRDRLTGGEGGSPI